MNSVHFKRLLAILLCVVSVVLSVPYIPSMEVKAATKDELVDSYKEQIKELDLANMTLMDVMNLVNELQQRLRQNDEK